MIQSTLNRLEIIFLREDRSNRFLTKVAIEYTLEVSAIIEFIKVNPKSNFTSQTN